MNSAFCFIAFAVAAMICSGQSKAAAAPDLGKYSMIELEACYNDKNICGTDDDAISDELTRRLPNLSTQQLIACFGDWKICGVENDLETGFAVSAEVASRGNPDALLDHYWTEPNADVRYGIVHVAYRFNSKRVIAFMQKVLTAGQGDDDALYWPASYLAKKCRLEGLKWLSMRKGRPEGCIVFTGTVTAFGKCQYRPAIPYLIENSMHDACLNIVGDAEYSLEELYPNHPAKFSTVNAEQKYYCNRAKQEGFKVACNLE